MTVPTFQAALTAGGIGVSLLGSLYSSYKRAKTDLELQMVKAELAADKAELAELKTKLKVYDY